MVEKRKRKVKDAEDEAIAEAVTEVEEAPKKATRAPAPPRLSITITPELRRAIRIASARADLEPGEWAKAVLTAAARKTVAKLYGEEEA